MPPALSTPSTSLLDSVHATYSAKLARLGAVLEITRLLAAEMNLDTLLPLAVRKTCDVLGADRASLFLIDEGRGELYTKVAMKLEIAEIRLPKGVGLAGHVARTGETLNIPDCYLDARFDQSWDKKTGYRTRSMMVMPVWGAGRTVIGCCKSSTGLARRAIC